MAVRKTTSLLLALVFLCVVAVPSAIADGTPPIGGDIHPWDNNDDFRHDDGGWVTSAQRPIIVVIMVPAGQVFVVYFGQSKRGVEASTTGRYTTDKNVKARTVAAEVDNR